MIPKKYEKINIKSIIINPEYSKNSNQFQINLQKDASLSTSIDSINLIRSISNLPKIKSFHEYFSQLSRHLNILPEDKINWSILLDKHNLSSYMNYLKKCLKYSENLITTYHLMLYNKRVEVYQNLNSVWLDDKKLEVPVYNHKSLTGRTTITSGFNFLTLKKEKRKDLSCENDDILVEIDLKSCEPSFYLKAIGKEIKNEDVYENISASVGIKIKNRSKFKRGILSILYGANEKTSRNILGCSSDDMKKIRDYFMIDEFNNYLQSEYEKFGLIYNYYGRPICSDHNLVNYWIQSSAVDYCTFAFAELIKDKKLDPCFFIHDSLTVRSKKSDLNKVKSIKSVKEKFSNIEIHVNISLLNE